MVRVTFIDGATVEVPGTEWETRGNLLLVVGSWVAPLGRIRFWVQCDE